MKLLIDTDAGCDDAQAILMALSKRAQGVDVLAITTVEGNATRDHCTNNVLRILNFAKRTDIPVFAGCDRSILGKFGQGSGFHGNDGLGDVPDLYPPSQQPLQKTHAVTAMTDLVNKHPGEVTLIALGPLTNIAVALRIDRDFCKKLKSFYLMGGNSKAMGNVAICCEFNFYCDPEAVHMVLNSSGVIPTVVPFETCREYGIPWEEYEQMTRGSSRRARFIQDTEGKFTINQKSRNNPYYMLFDQLAMAVLLNDDIVTEAKELYVTSETQGTHTRGQMVVDWAGHLGKEPNARVVLGVDHKRYIDMVKTSLVYED